MSTPTPHTGALQERCGPERDIFGVARRGRIPSARAGRENRSQAIAGASTTTAAGPRAGTAAEAAWLQSGQKGGLVTRRKRTRESYGRTVEARAEDRPRMEWSGAGEVSPEAHGNRKFAPTTLEDICATSHGAGEGRSLGSNRKSQIQKKKKKKRRRKKEQLTGAP